MAHVIGCLFCPVSCLSFVPCVVLNNRQPEFYKFMQAHGKDLLEFDDDEGRDDDDDDDDAEGGFDVGDGVEDDLDIAPPSEEEDDPEDWDAPKIPTAEEIQTLVQAARREGSWKAAKILLKHFRTACHAFDDRVTGGLSSVPLHPFIHEWIHHFHFSNAMCDFLISNPPPPPSPPPPCARWTDYDR